MSSRDYILGRVRWSLGRGAFERDDCDTLEARLSSPKSNLIPKRGQGELKAQISLFVKMAKEVNTTVSRIKSIDNVPNGVAKYLKSHELDKAVRLADHEELQKMDWSKLDVTTGPSAGDDLVAVVMAYAGVAETGSLALKSGPNSPTTLNFLPDYHIVVLKASDLVGDYEAVYGRMRRESNSEDFMPRALNWVTGPSRTADIEQTLLLGAHGPRKLHILLVEDDG
ncbi:LUD domain-containing protein [Terasakiella sp. A23]|uniref:LutC/YkgG family protein n=1 Tax=Terasakiella sp. FCG-A23 TaxID=3080561 RepID=UPI002952A7C0|nr:LUD domain-containing protein [Terasakiella sp. A23]MDV7339930.1 LUD domain-containing protein [Terasakiella sp. A23]